MSENSKESEILETLETFLNQFGSLDSNTKIVLEEFFKELLGEK